MNTFEICKQSPLFNSLSSSQKLGFLLEFLPQGILHDVRSLSHGPEYVFRGSIVNLFDISTGLPQNTLVLIEDHWLSFKKNLHWIKNLKTFETGFVVDRFLPLLESDFDFRLFENMYYHFPVNELSNGPYWLLDEIYLAQKKLSFELRGPKSYQIFDPAWKYSDSMPSAESNFHTYFNEQDFFEASKVTSHYRRFRDHLEMRNFSTQLLQLYLDWPFSAFLKFRFFWLKKFYWPASYRMKTLFNRRSAEEFEKVKSSIINEKR